MKEGYQQLQKAIEAHTKVKVPPAPSMAFVDARTGAAPAVAAGVKPDVIPWAIAFNSDKTNAKLR